MDDENSLEIDLDVCGQQVPRELAERPFIKIYLAIGLTGCEEQEETDDDVRRAIRGVFSRASCLKWPCDIRYVVYDPAEHTHPGTKHLPEQVYHIDFKELAESDFVLFYLNSPSFGVGIERQIAATASVPSGIICPADQKISRMFEGIFSGSMFEVRFTNIAELTIQLANAIAAVGPQVVDKARRRRKILAQLQQKCCVARTIFMRRVFLQIRIEDIAQESGIHPYWWTQLQRDTTGIIVATTLTSVLASELREILRAGCGCSDSGFPHFNFENNLGPREDASLKNMYEAYVSRKKITDDDLVLALWKEEATRLKLSDQPLLDDPVSTEEWLRRFERAERDKFALVIEPSYKDLPPEDRLSLDNLYRFCESMSVHPSQKTLSAMWETFRRDRRRRRAAREDQVSSYRVEDWQMVFNKLELQ